MFSFLAALESKRAEIQQQHALRNAVRTPTSKDIKAAVKAITLDLQSALNQDVQRARGLILGLFGRITVSQADGITALTFDEPHAALMAASGLSLGMVAGAGFVIRRRTIRL